MNMSVLVPERKAAPSARGLVSLSARSVAADAARDLSAARLLTGLYSAMASALGPMGWWSARTPFEVIVGAILTQNTAWSNVERGALCTDCSLGSFLPAPNVVPQISAGAAT